MSAQPPHVFVHVPGPLTPFEVPPAAAEGTVLDPTWEQVTEPLEPLARELARHHGPTVDGWRECHGCDWGAGGDHVYPTWPCETAEIVLRHLGLEPDGRGVHS